MFDRYYIVPHTELRRQTNLRGHPDCARVLRPHTHHTWAIRTGSVQFSILRCRFGIGLNEALTHFSISSNECLEMTHDFITFAE